METLPDGLLTLVLIMDIVVYFFATISSQALFSSESTKLKLKCEQKGGKKAYDLCENSERYNFSLKILKLLLEAILLFTVYGFFVQIDGLKGSVWIAIGVFIVATVFILNTFACGIAEKSPESILIKTTPFIITVDLVLLPIAFLPKKLKQMLVGKKEDKITEEELLSFVEEANEDGTLDSGETELISSVIEFNDVEVGEIFVPRVNVVAVDEKDSIEKIKKVFLKERYSRLPVYKGSIDTIIGVIHEKDFFRAIERGDKDISDIIFPLIICSEHLKIQDLLRLMQSKKEHMAVVVDEYGGVMGIVTLEDILEEIVGEIFDEHDIAPSDMVCNPDGSFTIDGNFDANEFFEKLTVECDDKDEYQTVSGWLIDKIGYIPTVNENFEICGLKIKITRANVKKIIQFTATPKGENE